MGVCTPRWSLPYIRRQQGFTLLELLVVLVIVALIVALAPPLWSNAVPAAEHRAATRQVAQLLRTARVEAVARRIDVPVQFDLATSTISLPLHKSLRLPTGITIELTTTEAEKLDEQRAAVRFYPDGGSSGGRVTLRAGERAYRVDIDWLTGRIAIDET